VAPGVRRLLLLGAGHAQLSVLGALAARRLPNAEVLLVTEHPRALYSGMVPGLVAGRFEADDCTIPIEPLASAAGVNLRLGRAVAMDAQARSVTLADGTSIGYDLLSLDIGGTQSRDRLEGARENALFVRPIEGFVALWQRTRALVDERRAEDDSVAPLSVVVIGNGAAAVELGLAVQAALGADATVALVCDGALLPSYPKAARRHALRALRQAQVQLLPGLATAVERWHVRIGDSMRVACDVPIVATGSDAPPWLASSGLALDAHGFVRVGATLQSASHPNVFAAGDVSARDDAPLPRSGVYALRAGPTLAANLRAALAGGTLATYTPQRRSLNLLALGDGRAIASWGAWSVQGRLMGWWTDRIDRAFIARWRREAPRASAAPPRAAGDPLAGREHGERGPDDQPKK
jgi:pyridine nucleotide-disulfide oxidoreductase family protein